MNPEEFLVVADHLASQPSEASKRSAISRAYYGVFHLARELIESCGVKVARSAEGHGVVLRCLQNCGMEKLARAGSMLDSLRSIRNKADYDLASTAFTPKAAETHIGIAKQLAQQVRQADPISIRQAIRTYAKTISIPVFDT